ncbi:Transmembrane protein fend [Armadillidium vulgare]|nr:Transmembrane protein fend [Armadillidium vulgare]
MISIVKNPKVADVFTPEESPQEDKTCKQSSDCYMCWQTCEKLSLNYPIWSFNCGHETRCNAGCGSACQFLSDYKDTVVPLSPYKSQLTLIFGGKSAEWNLALGPGVPSQKTVFSLFTRSTGRPWKLRLQTARNGAMLKDVVTGTQLKLVAVAESGLLSVIITPFSPSNLSRKGLGVDGHRTPEEEFPWNKDNVVRGDKDKGWPLLHQASVQDSGLVAAKVWWSTQRPYGSDYLVTWEVAGGGLKGHLYTDIPEVDLKLWPSTVYKVQVEVVSGPLGEPRISQLLILDTNNITAVTKSTSEEIEQVYQPQQDQQQLQHLQQQQQQLLVEPKIEPSASVVPDHNIKLEIIIGATLGGVLSIVIIIACIFRSLRNSRTTFTDVSSANSKLSLNRSINDFSTDESLVIKNKKDFQDLTKEGSSCPKLHSSSKAFTNYHAPFSPVSPLNTLGIIPSSSQNIYINFPTDVPVRSNRNPRVSII